MTKNNDYKNTTMANMNLIKECSSWLIQEIKLHLWILWINHQEHVQNPINIIMNGFFHIVHCELIFCHCWSKHLNKKYIYLAEKGNISKYLSITLLIFLY